MITIVPLGYYPNDCAWFMERNPVSIQMGKCKGVTAVNEDNEIQGIIMFDSWTENSCQVHIVIENPFILRHNFLEEAFKYAYETAGRGIIYGITPANNRKALKFNKHVGFVELHRLKHAHAVGDHLVIQEVRKEDYYGQISTRAA